MQWQIKPTGNNAAAIFGGEMTWYCAKFRMQSSCTKNCTHNIDNLAQLMHYLSAMIRIDINRRDSMRGHCKYCESWKVLRGGGKNNTEEAGDNCEHGDKSA